MFEIGWTELLVIAVVALVVFPSKDLPKLLRTAGQMAGKLRRMAGDFQQQFNSALREAEREADLLDTKEQLKSMNPLADVKKALDPVRSIGSDIKRDLTAPVESPKPAGVPVPPVGRIAVPEPPVTPPPVAEIAPEAPVPAEPIKTGPVPTPGATGITGGQTVSPPVTNPVPPAPAAATKPPVPPAGEGAAS